MDSKAAEEKWKSAKALCATTTSISLVLFGGLVVSFMGLLAKRATYSAAVASARAVERQKDLEGQSEAQRLANIGTRAYGSLVSRLAGISNCIKLRNEAIERLRHGDKVIAPEGLVTVRPEAGPVAIPALSAKEIAISSPSIACASEMGDLDASNPQQRDAAILTLTNDNERDLEQKPLLLKLRDEKGEKLKSNPYLVLRELNGDPRSRSTAQLLQGIIEDAAGFSAQRRLYVQRSYLRNRVDVDAVTLKLLGLEIQVGGLWAWTAWWFFFTLGMFYVWLSRRRFIRQVIPVWEERRRVWEILDSQTGVLAEATEGEGLPLWVRPLPQKVLWPHVWAISARGDIAADPLGALSLLLMVVCLIIGAIFIVPMGVLSSWILSPGIVTAERIIHAALFCILTGCVICFAVTWFSAPEAIREVGSAKSEGQRARTEIMGRRAWMAAGMGTAFAGLLYPRGIRALLPRGWLLEPRTRKLRPAFRVPNARVRRVRRPIPVMPSGFYSDEKGRIYYVPAIGKSRALAGKSEGELHKWSGPFDRSTLERVHPSARIPFVHAAVRHLLKGLTHRPAGNRHKAERVGEKKRLNLQPETQGKFGQSFELVREAIAMNRKRPKANAQMIRLLRSIAVSSQNHELLEQAELAEREEFLGRFADWEEKESRKRNQLLTVRLEKAAKPSRTNAAQTLHSRHSRRKQRTLERKARYALQHSHMQRVTLIEDRPAKAPGDPGQRRMGESFQAESSRVARHPSVAEIKEAEQSLAQTLKELRGKTSGLIQQVLTKAAAGQDFSSDLAALPTPPEGVFAWRPFPSRAPVLITDEEANQTAVARRSRARKHLRAKRVRGRLSSANWVDLLA